MICSKFCIPYLRTSVSKICCHWGLFSRIKEKKRKRKNCSEFNSSTLTYSCTDVKVTYFLKFFVEFDLLVKMVANKTPLCASAVRKSEWFIMPTFLHIGDLSLNSLNSINIKNVFRCQFCQDLWLSSGLKKMAFIESSTCQSCVVEVRITTTIITTRISNSVVVRFPCPEPMEIRE